MVIYRKKNKKKGIRNKEVEQTYKYGYCLFTGRKIRKKEEKIRNKEEGSIAVFYLLIFFIYSAGVWILFEGIVFFSCVYAF